MNSTIAYSIKSGAWTTRYSFTPTCYGVIDKNLVSCDTVDTNTDDLKSFWVHNEWSESPQGDNNFYGTLYPTLLTVSANNNPSGNKIFKSSSNIIGWENLENKENYIMTFNSRTKQFLVVKTNKYLLRGEL